MPESNKPIILVTDPGKERETVIRLARVGFAQMRGYLDGGFPGWKSSGEPVDMVINVDADEFVMDIPFEKRLRIVDVRREAEFADGHVAGALSIPLETLTDPGTMADFDDKDNIYIHCASGYRSMVAASLFKRQGIHNLHNVRGGWNEIKNLTGFNIEKEKSVLN